MHWHFFIIIKISTTIAKKIRHESIFLTKTKAIMSRQTGFGYVVFVSTLTLRISPLVPAIFEASL